MIMFQGFRAVQDTLSSLSEVLASPPDGVEAGDSGDEADRGRDQGAGAAEGDQEGEVAGAGEVEGVEVDCSQAASSLSSDLGTVLGCLTRTPWYQAYTHQEGEDSQVPGQVQGYGQVPNYSQVPSYGQVPQQGQVPVQGQVGGEAKLHSATYSVSDAWSKPMEYEDEFSWSVGGQEAGQEAGQGAERGAWQLESVESRLVTDNRLTQDYDDIDYTSGNLVSFHTSLAR